MRERIASLLLLFLLVPLLAPVYAHAVGGVGHSCSDQLCTCPPECPHHASGHGETEHRQPPAHGAAGGHTDAHGRVPGIAGCESEQDCHLATAQTPGHPTTMKALPRVSPLAFDRGPGQGLYARLQRQQLRAETPPAEPPRP
jgi:hypothetical protein